MAAQVKLVRRRDFGSDISTLSLFNYEDGFSVTRDGWVQAVARDDDKSVAEAMTLRVEGSSHDDLASKLQALDDKIQETGWYNEAAERYGVWLRAQLPDETGARQALVTQAGGEIGSSVLAPPLSPGNALSEYHLALERMPWWESTTYSPHAFQSLGCTGGLKSSVWTVSGTAPARIAKTTINGAPGGGSGDLYEFWLGFRTDRFGDQTNFVPVWDVGQTSDSTPYNDTITSTADTPYGGHKWVCSFGDESELKRVSTALLNHTSDYADQRGEYIVLLRAKVGASTVCHVRLKDGFVHTSALRAQPRVKVDSTSWYLYPLGTITIPPSRGIVEANFLRQYGFDLYASRESGSNDLDIDCFILIPRAEGFIHVSGGGVKYVLGDARPIVVRVHPDDEMDGWWYTLNMPYASVVVEPENYALPLTTDTFSVILAGQRETSHDLDDYVYLVLFTYEHWRTLKGNG